MNDEIKYSEVTAKDKLTVLEKMGAARGKKISKAAQQAIKEAALRREKGDKKLAPEYNGRKGLEPTRYSDWENKGITSDF